jgi:heptosyltransferase-2
LISKYNAKILLFGGPEEYELNSAIKNDISLSIGAESVHIIQMPSLMGSIALMQECKAFISNDSGLMHIAAALQLPQISIFGYTSHIHTAPWGNSNAFVARRAIECSPCFYFSPKSAHCKFSGTEKEFSCIREIKAHDIFHRLQALIH